MRVSTLWRELVTTLLLLFWLGGCLSVNGQTSGPSVGASLCEVLEHPMNYSGKSVSMTVRVTASKDSTSLWNPSCKNLGIDMQIDVRSESRPGVIELRRTLALHGLSDHPVIATMTGVFLYNDYDEIRHRRRSVLKVVDAAEIKQSLTVERR